MAFVSDIEDALLTQLNGFFNIPWIPDYGGGTEPTGDYGVVGITTMNKIHRDTNNSYDNNGTFEERLKQDYEVMITCRLYGDNCYDNAMQAQALLSLRSTEEDLHYNNDISIIDITSVRRIPELRETGYIQKASFDLNLLIGFEFIKSTGDSSDYFDTVEYTTDVQDEAGDTVQSITSTVSYP